MNIFVYANCQGIGLKKFLSLIVGDQTKINITNIENYIAIAGGTPVASYECALKEADVFVYQPIAGEHEFYSTVNDKENIISLLRTGCERISFPYIYNDGLWPCFLENEGTRNGEVFDEHLENGASVNDLLELYDTSKLYFDMKRRFAASLEILAHREASCDTQFTGFIKRNVLRTSLFNVQCHPSSVLFYELARQVATIIFGNAFSPQIESLDIVDHNLAALPGYYPIDKYCLEELDFPYFKGKTEEGAEHFYRSVIHEHCQRWLAREVAA